MCEICSESTIRCQNNVSDILVSLPLTSEAYLNTTWTFMMELFCKNSVPLNFASEFWTDFTYWSSGVFF